MKKTLIILLLLLMVGCASETNLEALNCQNFTEVDAGPMNKKKIQIDSSNQKIKGDTCNKKPFIQLDESKLIDRFDDDLIEKPKPIDPKEETE